MITTSQNYTNMDSITETDLQTLIKTRETHCISIYIPTHTAGENVLQGLDAKALDVELRKIRKDLGELGWEPEQIEKRLNPIEELRLDSSFWREQSEGLAIFASGDWFKFFRVPISFDSQYTIGDRFYLVPMIKQFTETGAFYLLSLELERIRLFLASREGMEEISVGDQIPDQKEDRVGYDYKQKSLQVRSQPKGTGKSGYHGHAESDWARKNEILRFFRSVDKGLDPLLDQKSPLLIASVDYLAAIYREASSYPNIMEETLTANLSEVSDAALWEMAAEIVEPISERNKKTKWEHFEQFHGTGKATTQLNKILEAGVGGRIDTLFIARGTGRWGTFDQDSLEMKTVEAPAPEVESLVNLALLLTLQQGGNVYEMQPGDMPGDNAAAAALFRY